MKDLTVSNVERQNVLNNRIAVGKIQERLGIRGVLFEGECRLTKKMVADYYEVEERTIERHIEINSEELSANGYILCKGKRLKELKKQFAPDINIGNKVTQLGTIGKHVFLCANWNLLFIMWLHQTLTKSFCCALLYAL